MPKNPDQAIGQHVPTSQMEGDLRPSRYKQTSAMDGPQFYALSRATVVRVDYEKFEVSLRTKAGEEIQRVPIPISFPGAGYRHFLGAMPEPGDVCNIGWGMQESGSTRVPVILSWIVPGVMAGHDWLPEQPYAPDESGTPPKLQHQMEGVLDRLRHKLRHLEPGHILASSSQGSDLVLNESVLLTNRRGNEIHLRDQDQAIVFRSLQQFHAGAGFRVYSGMVQRDATFLPTQMFSDGIYWDSPRQVDGEGNVLPEGSLGSDPTPHSQLTPGDAFTSTDDLTFGSGVNPSLFLQRGLFISDGGYARGNIGSDAIYGGKHYYRVSSSNTNGAVDPSADTFTEYRIEVAHTSDGILPVTEQTDGFDADRLPNASTLSTDPLAGSINAPFIEWVLGTVVGNDPFTSKGLQTYGLPLRPVIFDGAERAPAMTSGLGTAVASHAAVMLQVRPPVGAGTSPSFWTFTKDGRMFTSLQGPGDTWSAETSYGSGLRIGAGTEPGGQSVAVEADGAVLIQAGRGRNADNLGILLASEGGAVKIYAGGTLQEGGTAARAAPAGEGEGALPALVLESATNTLIRATNKITVSAAKLDMVNIGGITLGASTGLDFQSGGGISASSDTYTQSSTGKSTFNFSGPKGGLITNGALREVSFTGSPATGFVGGTADKYEMIYGDRKETIAIGNHLTEVLVGTQSYKVGTGVLTLAAGAAPSPAQGAPTSLALSPGTMTGRSPVVAFTATGGTASLTASTIVSLTGATMTLTAPRISFPGVHLPVGGIPGSLLTDGVLDPLTGKPFSLGGVLGVPTITVGAV